MDSDEREMNLVNVVASVLGKNINGAGDLNKRSHVPKSSTIPTELWGGGAGCTIEN